MSKLFQKLGKTRSPPPATGAAPCLTLAAFGKHPGWDDHMPGIGLDTETLAFARQTLYVTGIGRQIDSGAWEKLETDKRLEGFDHTFLWLREGHLVLGLLWSSKDGKGRAKYPMVLCVDSERVSPSLLLDQVRPGLEALRDACKAAITAEQVASNCRVAQEELRMLLTHGAQQPEAPQLGADPRRFLDRAELGPDHLGLLRVLHELSGSFGRAGDTRGSTRGGGAPMPSLHLRVPLAAASQNLALLLWGEFLQSAISSDIPLVLMARGQEDWLDVVVGEPKADDFFFLQASQKGFPLATQIPYELAPNARARLREVEVQFAGVEAAVPEAAATVPPPAPPPIPKAPPSAPLPAVATALASTLKAPPPVSSPTVERAGKPAPPSKRNAARVVGGVAVVLIAAFLVWLAYGKIEDQKHFEQLLASARAHLGEKKNDEAVLDLDEADKVRPQDDQVKQLLDQVRQQRESAALAEAYQAAMKNGRGALERDDYKGTMAEADKALSLKADDAAAKQLRAEAQTKLDAANQKEAAYQSAIKDARGALEREDYQGALAQADVALSLKDNDAAATQLRAEAQTKLDAANQKEAAYQAAMKDGLAELARGNYKEALTQADMALSLKPEDAVAKQLRATAQVGLDAANQKEAAYQSAIKDGRAALVRGDYKETLTQVDKALSLKPEDTVATQLRADAQAAQKEAAYQSAMKDGRGALEREDYQGALAQADMALLLKPDDADAKQLRDGAQQKLSGVHPQSFTNSIQMEFVWVPGVGGGGAYIGKYEVTEQQFQMIHGKLPNGQPLADANLPVAGVTFQEATEFCEALSKRENKHYTLPTRQQWLTATGLSEDKVADAWNILRASGALEHEATSLNRHPARTKPVAVGSMGASTNGVCDMFGNVREWVRENQRAGFSYQSSGVGRTGEMFLPGS
jgi:tetratricopeptide (TPR) repeat protein